MTIENLELSLFVGSLIIFIIALLMNNLTLIFKIKYYEKKLIILDQDISHIQNLSLLKILKVKE